MGGAAKNIGRGVSGVLTLGTSEIARNNLGKNNVLSKALQTPGMLVTGGQSKGWGGGDGGGGPTQAGSTDNPAQTLATTGGAPLLANVAMGADIKDTIAGYFGHDNYDTFYNGLSDSDKQLVDGVKNQLNEIQTNTNLRNQAVQQVVNDFPNIAKQAATAQKQAKSDAGEEFDATTKGYIDQALNGVAAKYAAGGSLSSGSMAAASARAGAEIGMDKLSYVTGEGDKAYTRSSDSGLGSWQARYNETNALRNFQNLMTQGAAGQGFSAVQAALGRTQQTNLTNAGFANDRSIQDKKDQDALFGSLGGLAGTVAGAAIAGPAGAMVGSQAGKMVGGGASDYGFSGPATPGYARNNSANNPNWD